jgi:2-amino-4-hydroxy-6-hydroxymethyldihydropteridine diphosphokinase
VILVGIGSNLAALGFNSPRATAAAALESLAAGGAAVTGRSRWYLSEPVPPSDQPWFVNAVASLDTALDATALLDLLLAVEDRFGRRRGIANAARTLDLDLLDYHGRRCRSPRLTLPHPRLHRRRFVLLPLAEIAPGWRHPRLGLGAGDLLARLPPGQPVRPLGDLDCPNG